MSFGFSLFMLLAVPTILSLGAGWFVANGRLASALLGAAIVLGCLGILLFGFHRLQPNGLVACLAPAFQLALGLTVTAIYRRHFDRDMVLSAYSAMLDPDRKVDAFISTVYFILAVTVPLVTLAFIRA